MAEAEFDLRTLCQRADVTPRTVHFYVQQGLLPPAGAPGPGARYGERHVARLKLIRLLQKQHLPLAEIARRLKGLSDVQVDGLLKETKVRRERDRGSALDYIRSVLGEPGPEAESRKPETESRSQWERFTLTDGIELHVRRPLSRTEQRQLDKILSSARGILGPVEEE